MSQSARSNIRGSSTKVIIVATVAVLSVVFAAGAYRVYVAPESGPEVSVNSYPLKLTMRLDKTDVVADENISLFFTLTNLSNDTIEITYPAMHIDEESELPRGKASHLMVFGYVVSNETGAEVFSRGGWAFFAAWSFTLAPLEKVSQTVTWNRNLVCPDCSHAPSGIYNIRGVIPPLGFMSINSGPSITIETPTIQVVVK